ncbi:unnamed protein product [Debaryomyces fabryi]|nr:unnamed protein product [Debaryomyces fabryi]
MAQLTPIRGFSNTPVSKTICIVSTLVALGLSIFQMKHYVRLSIDPYILEYSQYWRVITYEMSVINESDYMLCVLLWFHYKNLERFYGSRKYASLIVVFALYNSLVCFIVMSLGQLGVNLAVYLISSIANGGKGDIAYNTTVFNQVALGPLGILSSLYICYGANIPTSYKFKILLSKPTLLDDGEVHPSNSSKELVLTNHFQIHIIYTLLLLNNGLGSIIPCLVGIALGKLHSNELLPGARNWLIPVSVFEAFMHPRKLVSSLWPSTRGRRSGGYQTIDNANANVNDLMADEDTEEVLDEGRSNNQAHEIRAETPVRPLGSQFLDTFRT